jgi:D-3-phosphoglycerate dehydrogenase
MRKVLHLDENHEVLWNGLEALNYHNEADYTSSYASLLEKIGDYTGLIIRSRIPIDRALLQRAEQLQFIGRIGAGLENIDLEAAAEQQIAIVSAPEGNRNAVAEHALGMLLSLLNNLRRADQEVRTGVWKRAENRGIELSNLTVGIIGYGYMGKQFAKRLSGFDCEVLCHDILEAVENEHARQVNWKDFSEKVDVVSLHTPQTPQTIHLIDDNFIETMQKPFWLINTARGSAVDTRALLKGLDSGKIRGAALDVLEYENKAFTALFDQENTPEELKALLKRDDVLLSPHIAGWTHDSHYLLAKTVLDKIARL